MANENKLVTLEELGIAFNAAVATPLVVTITTGQWSGSGNDYYISISASNITADSILIPHYDNASLAYLKGPVWCVPAAGSFTIHTSVLPTGTVTILVQFLGALGEAQYQVLSDVYSKSQIDGMIANSLTVTEAGKILDARKGKALSDAIDTLDNTVDGLSSDVSSLSSQIATLNSNFTNCFASYTNTVTVRSDGVIFLDSLNIPSTMVPVFVMGSSGRLGNGTGSYEYIPVIYNDPDVNVQKQITVYCVKRAL